MTAFVKSQFNMSGEYVTYSTGSERDKFVARFKYAKDGKASFVSFLIKNFSVEEYFSALDSGVAPLKVLEEKGYVQPHVKKILKQMGFEPTAKGLEQYIISQAVKYNR